MIFLQPNWVLAFVFAFVLFQAGALEKRHGDGKDPGILWAGLSIAVSAIVIHLLHGQWFLVLLGQIVLFAGITLYRVLRER